MSFVSSLVKIKAPCQPAYLSPHLSLFPDHARFKERASLRNRCAIPRLDRFSFSFFPHPQRKQAISPLSFTFISAKSHYKSPEFSGTVFIQYRNIEDAGIVLLLPFYPSFPQAWGYLKDEQFAGAKLEVEYKKKQDKREFESAFKPVFLSAVAEQLWKQLTQFKERFVGQNPRGPVPSLVFPNDLSA